MAAKPVKAKAASKARKKPAAKKSASKVKKPAAKKVAAKTKVGTSRSTVKKKATAATKKRVVKKAASSVKKKATVKKKAAVKKPASRAKSTAREPSVVGKKIRQIREAMGASRPEFADLMKMPAATLKNYELGYREVGGSFLVDFSRNSKLHPFTLWLLSGKTSKSAGQISVTEFKKKAKK